MRVAGGDRCWLIFTFKETINDLVIFQFLTASMWIDFFLPPVTELKSEPGVGFVWRDSHLSLQTMKQEGEGKHENDKSTKKNLKNTEDRQHFVSL